MKLKHYEISCKNMSDITTTLCSLTELIEDVDLKHVMENKNNMCKEQLPLPKYIKKNINSPPIIKRCKVKTTPTKFEFTNCKIKFIIN